MRGGGGRLGCKASTPNAIDKRQFWLLGGSSSCAWQGELGHCHVGRPLYCFESDPGKVQYSSL